MGKGIRYLVSFFRCSPRSKNAEAFLKMLFDTAINENTSSKYAVYMLKSIHYSKVIK